MKILIDSAFRSSGTITDYTYIIKHPIKNCRNVQLDSAVFSKSFYNVSTGYNTFNFIHNTGGSPPTEQAIELPSLNYTPATLATAITSALNTAFSVSTYTCSYNSFTNKLSLVNSSTNWSLPFTPTIYGEIIYNILGITSSLTGITSTTVEEFQGMIDTSFPRYIYVELSSGGLGISSIQSSENFHSFVVDLSSKNQYDLEVSDLNSTYKQIDLNNGIDLKNIQVRLVSPVPSIPLDPNGVEHHIILECDSQVYSLERDVF